MQGIVTGNSRQLASALAKIDGEVRDGLKHGHFEITITCRVGNKGVRELMVKAGKNHQYRITPEELGLQELTTPVTGASH